jgi:hypothetical protein
MSESNFYSPEEVKPLYGEVVPVYQAAFKADPWNSATKCVDYWSPQRCKDGYSALEAGKLCITCGRYPVRPAFEYDELASTFNMLADTRSTSWYLERSSGRLALAMLAWKATAETITSEKYKKVPEMKQWVQDTIGEEPVGWLDEVFADSSVRPKGNLDNFVTACTGMAERLEVGKLVFRTVQPRMLSVARRFGEESSKILEPIIEVPDWRSFVVIDLEKTSK